MSKDFSGQNLRGCSFKGQDLEGADFSHADIRGADFTNANLRNANLSYVKSGLQKYKIVCWIEFLSILGFLLLFASVSTSGGTWWKLGIETNSYSEIQKKVFIFTLVIIGMLLVSISILIWKNLIYSLEFIALTLSILILTSGITHTLNLDKYKILRDWTEALTLAFLILIAVSGMVAVSLVLIKTLTPNFTVIPMLVFSLGGMIGALYRVLIRDGWNDLFSEPIFSWNWAWLDLIWGCSWSCILVLLGSYIGWLFWIEDKRVPSIRKLINAIAAIGGTNFYNTDLTDANFTSANLKNTDFKKANLTRTRFYETKKLEFARLGNTILAERSILNLLVTGNGRGKSYVGKNLRGANLQGADLKSANLKDADITEATFKGAYLEWANLTRNQAIDTDFTNAYMTGACVEAWNIESTTKLYNVDCRFVYLLENPKPGTDDKERRPSSGEFGKGEFTKLFQEVLNTVDIIFRDGIDWKAFIQSFRQVQVENEGMELSVNSIENKGDGVFVIKVNTPINTDKEKIHSQLVQRYEEQLKALESRYNLELQAKDRDIGKYRQRYTDIQEITKLLAEKQVPSISQPVTEKVVLLKLDSLDETTEILATAQIWLDNYAQPISFEGKLPPATKIIELYNHIHKLCNPEDNNNRAGFLKEQVTAFSEQEIKNLSNELEENINNWFNSPSFTNVANQLRSKLNPSDSVRFIIQTSDIKLKLLPLHLWEFFDDYRKAEIALSAPQSDRLSKSIPERKKVRVLVILGNSENIETGVQADLEALNQLPLSEIEILSQPNKQDLHEQLWHPLGWDILCFSGHSDSEDDGSTGIIEISPTEQLSLKYLKSALTNAIENGLQLAIFNSCKGLGIAQDLADLHIPQIIVMRQPVPDEVAQVFLKNFLQAFANGKSLYNSVREARQKLEGLEDRYPCASWLPVICQNAAEVPLKWLQFPGAGEPQIENLLTQLHRLIEEDYTITPNAQGEALEQVRMISEALQIQDELFDKRQVKTNITLLRGILAGQPAVNSLLVEVNEVLAEIYRLFDLS